MVKSDMQSDNYKRMGRNATMLYIRMLLTMVVTLYTSRVLLQTLGITDFGIYNVVAGFVTMLGFMNGAMSTATQRFLAYELGRSNGKDIKSIFSMSLNIHIIIAVLVFILGETIGLWFLQTKMNIPFDKIDAAKWVFHLSLVSFMVAIISVPYNALIIAHEQMSVFAWVSIIDVTLKLLIVFMLSWFGMNVLVLYALLSLLVALIVFLIYKIYCKLKYSESHFKVYWDRQLFRVMVSHTGWNLWGQLAAAFSGQGVNILLNMFFGPSINAARSIALQVSGALNQFVQNLQVAINPQIIKSYATNNKVYMHQLICLGAKCNFFILLLLALPVLNNIEVILPVWLGIVPSSTSIFVKLVIFTRLIDSLSPPLMTAAQASGHIKLYQFVVGGMLLLNLPLSYIVLSRGGEAYTVFYVGIILSLTALVTRILIISRLIDLKKKKYILDSLIPVVLVSIFVFVLNSLLLTNKINSLIEFVFSVLISVAIVSITVIFIGLTKIERKFLINMLLVLKSKMRIKSD